jgi:hypothetical protein
MTEALITELGTLSSLQVISRTSALHYRGSNKTLPEIARELGVDAVVEGAVERSGDQVRITAQLIEARSDHNLWAQSYDRHLSDILGLQDELARAIAGEVKTKLPQRFITTVVPFGMRVGNYRIMARPASRATPLQRAYVRSIDNGGNAQLHPGSLLSRC